MVLFAGSDGALQRVARYGFLPVVSFRFPFPMVCHYRRYRCYQYLAASAGDSHLSLPSLSVLLLSCCFDWRSTLGEHPHTLLPRLWISRGMMLGIMGIIGDGVMFFVFYVSYQFNIGRN